MKFKTTAKAIRQSCINPISAGYCELQHLLRYHEPIAYTCGVYGWNFDVYEIGGKTITTGYRGMVGRRCKNGCEYDKKAEAIVNDWSIPYEEKQERVEALLREFLNQA